MADYFPAEILLDIFHRLPKKSIGRCMCVCKYWLSIIKNPSFVSNHLRQTLSSQQDPLLILKQCSNQTMKPQYSLYFDDDEFQEYMKLEIPRHINHQSFSIIGSCNGLVCLMHNLYTYDYTILLWNPLIRKSIKLPNPSIIFETHGAFEALACFGFDFRTKDYKVLRVVRLLEYENEETEDEEIAIEVEIFSLRTNSWKTITPAAPQFDIVERRPQAFVNGAVHWIATEKGKRGKSRNLVQALDMETESFNEIALPRCLVRENPMFLFISKYKDSTIAVTRRNYLGYSDSEIWLMKEYGVAESWTRLMTVGRFEGGVPRALGFRRNSELLFDLYNGEMVSVDSETLELKGLGIFGAYGYSFVDDFVETLVLLDH